LEGRWTPLPAGRLVLNGPGGSPAIHDAPDAKRRCAGLPCGDWMRRSAWRFSVGRGFPPISVRCDVFLTQKCRGRSVREAPSGSAGAPDNQGAPENGACGSARGVRQGAHGVRRCGLNRCSKMVVIFSPRSGLLHRGHNSLREKGLSMDAISEQLFRSSLPAAARRSGRGDRDRPPAPVRSPCGWWR